MRPFAAWIQKQTTAERFSLWFVKSCFDIADLLQISTTQSPTGEIVIETQLKNGKLWSLDLGNMMRDGLNIMWIINSKID